MRLIGEHFSRRYIMVVIKCPALWKSEVFLLIDTGILHTTHYVFQDNKLLAFVFLDATMRMLVARLKGYFNPMVRFSNSFGVNAPSRYKHYPHLLQSIRVNNDHCLEHPRQGCLLRKGL